MALSEHILQILACPESKQSLMQAPDSLIQELNQKISRRELFTVTDELVVEEIAVGLIREDGRIVYRVREGIAVLLVEEGICVL